MSDTDSDYELSGSINSEDFNDFVVIDEGVETLESKEYQDIIKELRRPKLHLNPYPTYDVSHQTHPSVPPKDIKDEKERIKWLITNKLSPDMTLEEYLKFLEEQEDDNVKNFIRKSKTK